MVILQLEEQPPLLQQIFAGEADEVKKLLSQPTDVNFVDIEKRTPLHAAAFKGDVYIASLLLMHGARVNAKDSQWYTPLHRACCTGSQDTVCLLLRYQADTSARDRLWQTPLHIAAANNAYQCVEQLLMHVPNVNVTDRSGRTALHHAAYNGHMHIADLLISRGCIVNACDKKDCRPLHLAAYMGHTEIIDLLLHNGADVNAFDRNRYTALHVAAASGMEEACRMLLEAGAEVDMQNSYGNTPLHIACLNGHQAICQQLFAFQSNLESTNYRGQTPLHIAAASTHGVDCLMFLLDHNVDINRQSFDGRTALHMTAIHGRFTRSNMLIERGAIVDCTDKNGCTALHIAAQHGHELLTYTLLSCGADPTQKGFEGRTPLHMCCLSGYVECCRKFIQAGVDINAQDNMGKTPTHCAAYKGSVACLDLLVSNGADFRIKDNIDRTPLHYAVLDGNYQCVFTLGSIGSDVNATDIEGCSPLHLAAAHDFAGKCVEYLISHKADPTLKDQNGFTPVHYAVVGRNSQALAHVLGAVGTQFSLHSSQMPLTTPLHLAAKNGTMDILRMLLQHFPDTNIKTAMGSTPLLLSAREGHTPCVQMLLRYGAKVAISDNILGMGPVHFSAKNGHMHCLALLLDNTEDKMVIDRKDRLHRTPLMLATLENQNECVITLLKSGADPNVVDEEGHSSLFRAVAGGQNGIVQLLMSEGAKVGLRDVHGKTVLHIAAACGHIACMQSVHTCMTQEEAILYDNQMCNALHWACYAGNAQCVEYLLDKNIFKTLDGNFFSPVHCASNSGSEKCLELLCKCYGSQIVELKDTRKRRPLHIAAAHGHTECVKYLLEEGAKTELQDDEGRTPLIVAAQNGQSSIVELFIRHDVNIAACDKNGNTALHWASMKKHSHTALLLLEHVNNPEIVNMTNSDKRTALHLSARNGLIEVTRKLLETGASVTVVDSEGMTPALACAPNAHVAQCLLLILENYPHNASETGYPKISIVPKPKPKTFATQKCQTDMSLLEGSELYLYKRLFDLRPSLTTRLQVQDLPFDRLQIKKTPSVTAINCNQNLGNLNFGSDSQRSRSRSSHSERYGDDQSKIPKYGLPKHVPHECLHNMCADCALLQRQCAQCTLMKLMRQHMLGKIDINELRARLTKICSDEQPEYKKLMIHALEKMFLRKTALSKHMKNDGSKTCAHNKLAQICEECLIKVKSEDAQRPSTSSTSFTQKCEHPKTKSSTSKIPRDSKEFFIKQVSESASKHFNQTPKKPATLRPGTRECFEKRPINKNLEPFRSLSVTPDSNKAFEQLTEENFKRNRTQRLPKLLQRNVEVKKLKKLPQKRALNDYSCTLKYQKNSENHESKAKESDVVQELFSKEKQNRNLKKNPADDDVPSIRIIESASDDAILQIDSTIEREHEENLKKQAIESFENLQKCKQFESKPIHFVTIHDSLEKLKHTRDAVDIENAQELENVSATAETYEIFKADDEKIKTSESDVEFEVVGGEAQNIIEMKMAESAEKIEEISQNNTGCGSNSNETVAEVFEEPERKIEEATEKLPEVTDKPLVSGNLSQISYDSLKKDSLWEDIENNSEMHLLNTTSDATCENSENDRCPMEIHQDCDENAQENIEEDKVYKDTTNPKKRVGKPIKDNNCVLS